MNGVALTLRVLHDGEEHLARQLTAVADRHRADHEVHHIALDLAAWSRTHARRLSEAATDYGPATAPGPATAHGPATDAGGPTGSGTHGAPGGIGDPGTEEPTAPGLLLLRDLSELHLAAAANSLHWEMLAQTAQATRDDRLLGLASTCHPQTLRQMRWTNTMIKNLSPQILTSL